MQQCDGQCCQGRGSGAMGKEGGCSGVFVLYLHMAMSKIHWREEVDPINIRIKDIEIFFCVREIFFSTFFWRVFLPSVGCRVG